MSIITITGDLASGKSMVAKELATRLSSQYFSTGKIQREIAAELGMTTLELNTYSEKHHEIDDQIDQKIKTLASAYGEMVIDSRMAWHFIPTSFKVYLSVDVFRAAERVMADNVRTNEPEYLDISDAITKLQERKNSENKRYMNLYQADCTLMTNFNIVVDSTFSSPEETLNTIISLFKNWDQRTKNNHWFCPLYLYPMEKVRVLISDIAVRLQRHISDNGFDTQFPIEVVEVNNRYYIWNGHKRVYAAIKNNLAHIPVSIIAKNNEEVTPGHTAKEFVLKTYHQSTVYDWEDALGVSYLPHVTKPN